MENVTVEDIMASLDKETRAKVILGRDVTKQMLPTASYGINRATGGGLRLGKQHTFYGMEGSAKTALMLQTVAINQALGVPCMWIDSEDIYDADWAAKLGVDNDRLILSTVSTISEATNEQRKFIEKGVRLIVIDTTSELFQSSFVDGDELKDFDDTKQQGTQAKDLGKMSKMVQGFNHTCAIVHISQVRVDLGASSMNKPFIPAGGKEIRHNDALKVRLSGTKATAKQILGDIRHGEVLVEEAIGYPVTWNIEKNRLTGNEYSGVYNFYKKGDKIGVDRTSEVLNEAIKYGIVNQGGAWFTVYGEKFQGDKKVIRYLDENPEILEKVEAEIDAKSLEDIVSIEKEEYHFDEWSGQFSCMYAGCDSFASIAKYEPSKKVLTWVCRNDHVSVIEDIDE